MNKKEYDEWYWKQHKKDKIKEEIVDTIFMIFVVLAFALVLIMFGKAVFTT